MAAALIVCLVLMSGASVGIACTRRRTRAQAVAAVLVATVAAGYLAELVSVLTTAL